MVSSNGVWKVAGVSTFSVGVFFGDMVSTIIIKIQ